MLRNEGYDVQTEVRVPTPMGAKQTRYVDVVGVKKDTGETKVPESAIETRMASR